MSDVVDAVGSAASDIADAVGDVAGAVGGAVSGVAQGIGSVVGDIGEGIGDVVSDISPVLGDLIEKFGPLALGIGLTVFTGGLGAPALLGELGGMGGIVADAASFLGGASDLLGGLGGLSEILPEGLGDVLGFLQTPGFDLMGGVGDLAGGLLGGDGVVGNVLGSLLGGDGGLLGGLLGNGGMLGDLLGGLGNLESSGFGSLLENGLGKLLPAVTDGAGILLNNLGAVIPDFGDLLQGLPQPFNPNQLLGQLLGQAGTFNPADLLKGLSQGFEQLADMIPDPSKAFNGLLSALQGFAQGGMDPSSLLKSLLSGLGGLQELAMPFAQCDPASLAGNVPFLDQFARLLGGEASSLLQTPGSLFDKIPFQGPWTIISQELKGIESTLGLAAGGDNPLLDALAKAAERNLGTLDNLFQQPSNFASPLVALQQQLGKLQDLQGVMGHIFQDLSLLQSASSRSLLV